MRATSIFSLFLCIIRVCSNLWAGEIEGSGVVPDFANNIQLIIEKYKIPFYLLQKVNQLAGDAKTEVDDEEILMLDSTVPTIAEEKYRKYIYDKDKKLSLKTATENFQKVVFYAFRPFGCEAEDIWPSVYNFSRVDVQCLSNNLIVKIYRKSPFTQKYFARAIHFGLTSTAPIDHRVNEMLVYQYLLPNSDHAWFKKLKDTFKNSIWNTEETNRYEDHRRDNLGCPDIEFNQDVQEKIYDYVNGF